MPKELHDKLMKQAKKMGLIGDKKGAYVYGTMEKIKKKKRKKRVRRKNG